jgi:hypothetical protein
VYWLQKVKNNYEEKNKTLRSSNNGRKGRKWQRKGDTKRKRKRQRGRAKQPREMLWAPRGLFIWHH